jgi:hypothetical protein
LITDGYARLLAQVAALMRVLCPVLVLTLPLILRSLLATRPEIGVVGPLAFGGIVALLGLATACTEAADQAYFRDALAPVHRLATRGLLLIVLVVGSVAYLVGGAITNQLSFEVLLMVAFVVGMLTLFTSGILLAVPPAETRDLTTTGALPTYRDSSDW